MTNQELQILKNKFDIIGNDQALNRALEVAVSVKNKGANLCELVVPKKSSPKRDALV